jgi:DNA helicase-2/ATP-dependent DNA helicase PcrA
MSALDRLSTFSMDKVDPTQLPFDNSTIDGYFFNALHREGFNLEELKPVIEIEGNSLVVSIAGSGKTTFMIFKVLFDIVTGRATTVKSTEDGGMCRVVEPILVSTFSKAGVGVLQKRFGEWVRRLRYNVPVNRITFKTLHGVYMSILSKMNVKIDILTDKELRALLKSCVTKLHIEREDRGKLTAEDYRTIEAIITYYRNRLDDKRYCHPSCSDYGLIPIIQDKLVEEFKQARRRTGKYDFDDMQELLLEGCRSNPEVRNLVASQFKYFYFDESQDTSQVQYELIKYMTAGATQVLAVGDDDQTIYTWRGSDVNILTKHFAQDFNASVSKLTTNYRCPSNVLEPISRSIIQNKNRFDKNLRSFKSGGEMNVYAYPSLKDLGSSLTDMVKEDIQLGNSVAILCRTNFDGAIPAFLLEACGVYDMSIKGEMTLDSPLPKKLVDAVALIIDRAGVGVKSTLETLVDYRNRYKVSGIVDTWKNTGTSFLQVSEDDLRYTLPELIGLQRTLRNYLYPQTGDVVGDDFEADEFSAYEYLLNYMKFSTFKGESPYCENARAYIDVLLFLLTDKSFDDLYDFRDTIRTINGKLASKVAKQNATVTITTAHDAKGLEWDSVYIWNDSEGVFPSHKTEETLDISGELDEEERRVHYIAWTRAVKKCTVTTIQGKEGKFLKETNLPSQMVGKLGGIIRQKSVTEQIEDKAQELHNRLTNQE